MRTLGSWGVVLGIALLVANVAPALAQEGGRRGGRQGGGRGGMMGPAGLLTNETVQKELQLDPEQVDKVKKIATDVREKYTPDFSGLRDLSPEERREKMQELGKKINDEVMKSLADVLKPDQIERFKQIQLQVRARTGEAFNDPEVQKALKFTDEQKEKIKTINADARKEMSEIGRGEGAREKMAELRKSTNDKIMSVLTDEQKETWKTMTGKHVEIPFGAPLQRTKTKG